MLKRRPIGGLWRTLSLVVALLVLCAALASALQHAAFDRALRSADFVERAQSMRVISERLRRELSDALIVVGEHALNGGPTPAPRFEAARTAVQADLAALAGLADQDSEQRQPLATVRGAVDAVMDGLSASLIDGHDDPQRTLAALRDQRFSARIAVVGQALDAFEAHEQRLLARRRQALETDRLRTELLLAGGNVLALAAMLGLLGLAVRAHLRSRLAEGDARYRVLFESSPMPMWVLDQDSDRFLEVNAAAVAKYGWSREAFLGLSPCEPRLTEDPEAMRALLRNAREPARSAEMRHRRSDGTPLDVTVSVSALVFRGRPARLAAIEDITSRRAAERERESMRRRIDDIVQQMSEGFVLFDRQWRTLYANNRAVELLDRPRAELVGRELWSLFPAAVDTAFGRAARHVAATGQVARVDEFFARLGRWFDMHVYPAEDGIAVLFQDTTRRRDNERLLIERERLLTDLSRKLLNAQEDERRAIARELHDHLLQEVAAAKLALVAARRSADRGAVDARLDQALAAFDALIAQLRNRALDLHPAILEDLGLSAAIDWLCERQRALAGLQVVREPDEPVPRLDRETEAGAFRIAQEAISNAIRHARARTVRVRVGAEAGRLRLTVADDGIGMSAAQRGARLRDSLGLVSMRERAELLGGCLSIDSVPGGGTRIDADLPLMQTSSTTTPV